MAHSLSGFHELYLCIKNVCHLVTNKWIQIVKKKKTQKTPFPCKSKFEEKNLSALSSLVLNIVFQMNENLWPNHSQKYIHI